MNIFIKCLNCIPRGKIHYCAETFLQIEGSYPVASNTLTMKISYIGHATVIVDGAKCKFITDPLLVKRIFGIGPKRRVALLLDRDALADLISYSSAMVILTTWTSAPFVNYSVTFLLYALQRLKA